MTHAKKILVIDDEASIRKFLKVSLENEDYLYYEAINGKEGITQCISVRPDFIILDLALPDLDGLDVIKSIRDWSTTPIIVLTVRDDEESKVKILDAGADDYLTKPFSVSELLARIRVVERRTSSLTDGGSIFKSGQLEVNLTERKVSLQNKEIRLTVTEYDILKLLIKHAGKVVTHRQMLKEIWGPNSVEHTQYLRVYVGHLRKKLTAKNPIEDFIQTEPGVGYRLRIL